MVRKAEVGLARLAYGVVGLRPDPWPGRNPRFGGSGSCEPNLNRILNGSWAVPVLGGSGPVPVRFFFLIYIDKINKINC